MEFEFVPCGSLTLEEIGQRIAMGWKLTPAVPVRNPQLVATLDSQPIPIEIGDLWVRYTPMIPVSEIIVGLQRCVIQDMDRATLDRFCQHVFGLPLSRVIENDTSGTTEEAMGNVALGLRAVGD